MQPPSMEFQNVTALAEANIYFDGKVISHTILLPDSSKKTLGVILPGEYHFGTEAAELMEIVAGSCSYLLDGTGETHSVPAGSSFNVPANSGFTITVTEPCHYVCSFLSE
ncbi:MAG: pyrimidine/purine nucleoside phosphorylase [Verrucomicrobiota bacterium]